MLEGLNTAAAGMAAQQARIDAVSNDLANANTNGYKRVRVGFQDLLYRQTPRSSVQGPQIGAGAKAVDAGRAFAQGALQRTDSPLDVAIQGDGFFRVKLDDGTEALTRDGSFRLDESGRLVTSAGAYVQPDITIPESIDLNTLGIGPDGTISAGGQTFGRIDLVGVRSQQGLRPIGDNNFVATDASGPVRAAADGTFLSQGALEMSNTDVAEAMIAMIESQRAYQLTSKAIQTADQMWEIANGVKR